MLANFLGWNLKGPFVKKIWASFTYSTLHALSFAEAVSCRNRVTMVKKYTKKRDVLAKLSYCHNKPIAFLPFSLPSPSSLLLKAPCCCDQKIFLPW